MKKLKLKSVVKKTIITAFLLIVVTFSMFLLTKNTPSKTVKDKYVYVNDYIFDNYYPVINQEEKAILPYKDESVKINKNFYDLNDTEENQQKSIVYHEGIYMQNSGIDYISDNSFDIISVFSGTITNVSEDSLLGKTLEVKVSNDITMLYQCLSETNVKKGDVIVQDDVIGKSGSCSLYGNEKNNLHIEMYKNGSVINPLKVYNKSIKEIEI